LIFDLDGTLIDSAGDIRAALNHALTIHGRPKLDIGTVRAMTGDGIAKLVERGFAASGALPDPTTLDAAVRDALAAYTARPTAETAPYPGVVEALEAFRAAGLRMAICTNKAEAPSRLVLDELDLAPFFGTVIGGDSLRRRKPDPEAVLVCLEGLGVAPGEALFVGDSRNDVLSAHAAGLPAVLIPSGYGQAKEDDPTPDLVVEDMVGLARIILLQGGARPPS
jgi:phosphoglycolate phosphatase